MSRSQEGKEYRERRRARIGEDAHKAEQNLKRKQRYHRLKEERAQLEAASQARAAAAVPEERKVPPKPSVKAPAPPISKTFMRNILFDQIYTNKLKQAQANGRTIKKSTVEQQFKKVENIHMALFDTELKNMDWLNNTNRILNYIENNLKWKTKESKNSQLQAIASVLKALPKYADKYKIYSNASISGRKSINKDLDENKLNDNQPVVKWKDIRRIKATDTFDAALIGLYSLLPPRRVEDVNLIRLSKTLDKEKNILLMKDGKPTELYYNVYKTAKTYKSIRIKVPERLSNILKKYIDDKKLKDGDYLFGNSSNFSAVITSTFSKYTNKKITANTLRHSYISMYLSKPRSIADKKHIGRLMGHSIGTQAKYMKLNLT